MERDKNIDVAKGIGIMLVILGHISTPHIINKTIYAFHMPLFFIISGYLYNTTKYSTYTFVDFVKKKFKNYIIPYFKISIVCFIIFGVVVNYFRLGLSDVYFSTLFKYVFGIIYSIGTVEYMPNCSPIWFLTCLFCAEIIFFVIIKYTKRHYIFILLSLGIGIILDLLNISNLPWNIDTSVIAVTFIYVGYILKRYRMFNNYKHGYSIILIILSYISIKYNTDINVVADMYGNYILFYIGAISLSVLILYYSKYIVKSKILNFFGKNTLFIMGYNYAINSLYGAYGAYITIIYHWSIVFFNTVVLTMVIILVKNIIRNKSIQLKETLG